MQLTRIPIKHFHLFCGLGGGALGFNQGTARVGNLQAEFRCLGGVDCDAAVIRDFTRLVGVPGTLLDLFDREQYTDFHGQEPPADWREASLDDIRRAAGGERPDIVFTSAPCKGFSGLLSQKKSTSRKYRALNRLTERGIWLALESWADDPVPLIIFENVPRIASRGRELLGRITALLRHYGYAVAETTHDCGELGGLSQSRKRFLLVARHCEKVPPFLYEPDKRPLGSVGDVLEKLPLPGQDCNPMHSLPALQWKTWVRLAFVEAGSDWRSLQKLAVQDGVLRDFGIVPERVWQDGALGVLGWNQASGVVTAKAGVQSGRFSVGDPREFSSSRNDYLGVLRFDETAGAVTGNSRCHSGRFNVGDPRINGVRHHNIFRVVTWGEVSPTVTSGVGPTSGGLAVADPRGPQSGTFGKYAVTDYEQPAGTVIAGSTTGQGAFAVADQRVGPYRGEHYGVQAWSGTSRTVPGRAACDKGQWSVADPRVAFKGKQSGNYLTSGHYGVQAWSRSSGAVIARARHDKGAFSVADPRLPEPSQNLTCVIIARDGTWHRPFTTLELAALQGLLVPGVDFALDGESHQHWRERIGNAVPPPAARAIAGVMGTTLLLAMSGEKFHMSRNPIWVRGVAAGLSLEMGEG